MMDVLNCVAARHRQYLAAEVSQVISEQDAMYQRNVPGAMEHYLSVGRSAIRVIAEAMILAGKSEATTVLDLPSGAGRVTRHLAPFFPDAVISVGDIDREAAAFAANAFGASLIEVPADFREVPRPQFDLIFAGSLLTHLPSVAFVAALRWFIAALSMDGVLIATTQGRRADYLQRTQLHHIDPERWNEVRRSWYETGFGYVETERRAGASYGYNLTMPSWCMSLLADYAPCRILGFKEAAWDNHQDALIVQRRAMS